MGTKDGRQVVYLLYVVFGMPFSLKLFRFLGNVSLLQFKSFTCSERLKKAKRKTASGAVYDAVVKRYGMPVTRFYFARANLTAARSWGSLRLLVDIARRVKTVDAGTSGSLLRKKESLVC